MLARAHAPAQDSKAPAQSPAAPAAGGRGNGFRADRVKAMVQGGAGEQIAITPDLAAMISGREVSGPDVPVTEEEKGKGYSDTQFKGTPFVKGASDTNDIDPNDAVQGSLANCYFIAAMEAVARANPEAIRKLIKDNGNGTFDVTLYISGGGWSWKASPKVYTVDDYFPGKSSSSPAYAKTGDSGEKGPELWAMLLEKAYAKSKGSYKDIAWGNTGAAMEMLTGQGAQTITPASYSDEKLAEAIDKAIAEKRPVACATKDLEKESEEVRKLAPSSVVGKHAYAPISVNKDKKTITLQNPWGASYQVNDLPLSSFKKLYHSVYIGAASK